MPCKGFLCWPLIDGIFFAPSEPGSFLLQNWSEHLLEQSQPLASATGAAEPRVVLTLGHFLQLTLSEPCRANYLKGKVLQGVQKKSENLLNVLLAYKG